MFLFIDTNSLLRLADFAHGLDILNKLLPLIKGKRVTLLVSKQLAHEYSRNIYSLKNDKKKDKRTRIDERQNGFNSLFEAVKKELGDETANKLDIKGALQRFTDSLQTAETEAEKIAKPIREKIDELFSLAITKTESQELIRRAQERVFRGDPPFSNSKGGRTTGGDAINWEFLLEYACDDDLAIITKDGDYGAAPDEIHPVLQLEWEAKTKKSLKRYEGLGAFVNAFTKANTIDPKEVKEEKELPTPTVGAVDMYPSSGYFSPSYGSPITFDAAGLAKAYEALTQYAQKQEAVYASIASPLVNNLYSSSLFSSLANMEHVAEVFQSASDAAQKLSTMQSTLTSVTRGAAFPWRIGNRVTEMTQATKQEMKKITETKAVKEPPSKESSS